MQLRGRHCWTVVHKCHIGGVFRRLWCLKKVKSPVKGVDLFQLQGELYS